MRSHAIIPLVLAFAVAGCAHITAADRAPRTSVLERMKPSGEPVWREDLNDPVLRDLLRRVDAASLDEKTALARLARAHADVIAAKAAGSLQVGIGANAAVGGRTFSSSASGAVPSLEASYEIDLWGQLAKGRDAAAEDAQAATFDLTRARLLVGEETARIYVALRGAEAATETARQRRDLSQRAYDLVSLRAGAGAAGGEDVATYRRNLVDAQVRLQEATSEVERQKIRLGALLAETQPWTPPGGSGLPTPSEALPQSISSAVVDRRPDVMAAFARLSAADARRAQAVASAQPQFMISAALGAPDAAIVNLLDARSLAWALAATLSQALVDGQAGRARIDAATAEADAADLAYRKVVVQGWAEVRQAVVDATAARTVLDQARGGLADAQDAVRRGRIRHTAGTLDGLGLALLEDRQAAAMEDHDQAAARVLIAQLQLALVTGG